MKINITKTVLSAMPDVAWSMFCRFMTDIDVEYTPIQKPAALYLGPTEKRKNPIKSRQNGQRRGIIEV